MLRRYIFIVISCQLCFAEHDFRYISFQDLQQDSYRFSQHGITSYSQILFDVSRSQLLVGARDALYRLSLKSLELLEHAEWEAPYEKRTQCINKGQSEESCHNYIKILLTNGRYLFVCGTNAFSPQCTYRKVENITDITETVDGIAKCPYDPNSNITGLMSESGEYYFGGSTDFSGSDALIAKTSVGSYSTLRTKQYNSLWLNEPQFIGSFETDNFIYFLFREAAVEYINCGKAIYSRIARVCKNDSGGLMMLRENWTTFIKARLNCSISGEYPFYFDEIQGMSYLPEERLVYATFTTPTNSIAGSAICAFNLTAIEHAFSGPFKYQEHMGSAWGKHYVQRRDHLECKPVRDNHLLELSKYQLLDGAVQATTTKPLHVASLERFTHITVDVLSTKLHNSFHVVYVANTEGIIKKISVLPRTQEACIVEIWKASPNSLTSIQFLKETNSIYASHEFGVMKIGAAHCSRHLSRSGCMDAMDPYCGWNERDETCSQAPNSDPLDKYWKQSVTSCPIVDTVIDGGWSSWSEWHPCQQDVKGNSNNVDTCMCRKRHCNNPSPKNGGKRCEGNDVAVTNCTVHGGWSDWSTWSPCSGTCGSAMKTRSRTCTNPAPAYGGRVCVGQDRKEAYCTQLPPCPALPIDGGWSEWDEWGPCSTRCGGGFKTRNRRCDTPVPKNGGQYCVGNDIDYETCNLHECNEHKKFHVTDWFVVSNETNGVIKRFKFTCKAPVKQLSQIKFSIKEQTQTCSREDRCITEEKSAPKWSNWSDWTECTAACGGGTQNRTRYCEGYSGGCRGEAMQTRECNRHECQDEWGCWSEWSPCNVSCGWGVKVRYRNCLGTNCKGIATEEQPCEQPACDSLLGWGNWSSWSVCDNNNEQHRKRRCLIDNPSSNMCQGITIETRMCVNSEASPLMFFVGLIVGLALGGALGVAFMCVYTKKKKVTIPSSPHYISAKQNPYITVPLQDKPIKKYGASTSNILGNGTIKSFKHDYDCPTLKRNSHNLINGHRKQDYDDDDY